jgi:S1-C subfamily serine protease
MARGQVTGVLAGLSAELAGVVGGAAASVVRVDDGSRFTASGVVWNADGVVVTTSHGVERDEELIVELADGRRGEATLVGRDYDIDLAVLRAPGEGLEAIVPAPIDDVRVGQLALALGRPGAGGLQATIGIVSARLETESSGRPGYLLHTDAVLYPGFSGGPLVDVAGRTVGIVNRMFGRGAGVAIGTPVVAHVVEALLAHGQVRRGYLGISAQPVRLPEALRAPLSLQQERGLLVVQVESGSPAEQAGLLLGDTLLAIDAQALGQVEELRRQLRGLAPGQAVTLRLLRGGELRELGATLGAVAH